MRVGLAQIDPTVGDVDGNVALVLDAVRRARDAQVQLLLVPELAISGYPPEDLLLREDFLAACQRGIAEVAAGSEAPGPVVLCGYPERTEHDCYNSMAVCHGGRVHAVYRKAYLPNYGVFDERRYHAAPSPERAARIIRLDGTLVGLTICEDIWYPGPPLSDETLAGAELIANISASPYRAGIAGRRVEMLATRCRDNLCTLAYCNTVGGQDELVFDGGSMVVGHEGEIIARGPQYREALLAVDVDLERTRAARLHDTRYRAVQQGWEVPLVAELSTGVTPRTMRTPPRCDLLEREAEVYGALSTGVGDYVRKSGFDRVLIGLSGGVDSALVAVIAVDALGAGRVTCVVMPSPHSSPETQGDARTLARNLGVDCREIPIGGLMDAYLSALGPSFAGLSPDVTEENLQARIRGNLLMALSNKFGWLLLTTGNKSELAVGYCTLYGDMAGGFAVIKDVPKQLVFDLIRWRNARDHLVPASIIERPPSAELRADQRDTDSLPTYDVLDGILQRYVECDETPRQIIAAGFDAGEVMRVVGLVDRAEYKRRQAPPGVKITARAFGRDRRMPVVNRFRSPGGGTARG
jgi:NAD+ synthase (glutamine-hydrolysing)